MTRILVIFGVISTFIGISQCELMKLRACEGRLMKLFCESNEIIIVNWANYGRTDNSFCHYFEDIEASNDCRTEGATDIVKKKCDGTNICFVEATNKMFGEGDPCPGQVKFVEATYECVQKPIIKLDPNDIAVEMQEKELLQILKGLGEKDSSGQDLKPEQALGLLNLFANAEAEAEAEVEVEAKTNDEDNASNPQIWK